VIAVRGPGGPASGKFFRGSSRRWRSGVWGDRPASRPTASGGGGCGRSP